MRYLRLREFNNLSIFPQWKVRDLGFLPGSLTSVPLPLITKMRGGALMFEHLLCATHGAKVCAWVILAASPNRSIILFF